MEYVYLLEHSYEQVKGDPETREIKSLGVFTSTEEAEEAIKFYKALPGFRDYPDGFFIDKCKLGQKEWVEGFIKLE